MTQVMQAQTVIELSLQQVTKVTGGALIHSPIDSVRFHGVSIDTRTLHDGELYVALRGANHDGHRFLRDAQSAGAAGALLEQSGVELLPESLPGVVVPDSHRALIDLAIAHRKCMTKNTAGITGSVGKTTVKELTRYLIESAGATAHASAGNLNNLYGLPLSILQMSAEAKYGIFELGISTPGEMERLGPILQPRVGVITNVGATHVEALGSVDGVRAEKVKLLANLSHAGCAVVDGADAKLVRAAKQQCGSVTTFAVVDTSVSDATVADVVACNVKIDSATGHVSFEFEGKRIQLPLFGVEHVANALCAYATCQALGVAVDMKTLETFSSEVMALRGGHERVCGVDFVVDCYNANPESMRASLRTFAALASHTEGARKIVALGDMLELGEIEEREHRAVGRYIASLLHDGSVIDVVVTVGERAQWIAEELKVTCDADKLPLIYTVANATDAGALLLDVAREGDTTLLKASRGVALESALDVLKARERE